MGRLMIVAPLLRVLDVRHCFYWRTYRSHSLVRDQLEDLIWVDAYDPTTVQFGGVERLRKLVTLPITVCGLSDCMDHMNSIMLLQRFETVSVLELELDYPEDSEERISVFSTWFRGDQAETRCSANCICNQPQAWKTEDLFLDSLREVEISGFRGSEHELSFVKRLFGWAAILKTFTVHLHLDLTVSNDLCKELLSLATPETDVKIYFYRDDVRARPPWVLYTPAEQGTNRSKPGTK